MFVCNISHVWNLADLFFFVYWQVCACLFVCVGVCVCVCVCGNNWEWGIFVWQQEFLSGQGVY